MRFLFACGVLLLCGQFAAAGSIPLGETLAYQVAYRGIASGYLDWEVADATFSVSPQLEAFDQKQGYRFRVEVDSSAYSVADALFKTRYVYSSLLDATKRHVLLIEEKNQGRKRKHKIIWFDWRRQLATPFKLRRKKSVKRAWFSSEKRWIVNDNEQLPQWLLTQYPEHASGVPYFRPAGRAIALQEQLDQLSATYVFRGLDIEVGKTYHFPICTGKKNLMYSLTVERAVRLEVGAQTWDTFEISINTSNLPGVFERSDDTRLRVWMTRDARHIPVLFEAKVIYGTFKILLK